MSTTQAHLFSQRKFKLGKTIVFSNGVKHLMKKYKSHPRFYLGLHEKGHWGFIRDYDKNMNDHALETGSGRIFSSYCIRGTESKIWVITDFSDNSTSMLLPEEY
ncbi:MAG: hypothetical protein CMD81_08010 [Gammaproteobacteria bacterium]|nr:hypothetical protein [Gammaproteobacteria bacterium]MBK82287.1 hypothetical protein [Gammaproteobacteria bacterium]MBK83760.1 hypothetical protein [Gammaproteobacteria bacterium]HCV02073.1 hypothetical protein [Pseudoalteromonas sp.]